MGVRRVLRSHNVFSEGCSNEFFWISPTSFREYLKQVFEYPQWVSKCKGHRCTRNRIPGRVCTENHIRFRMCLRPVFKVAWGRPPSRSRFSSLKRRLSIRRKDRDSRGSFCSLSWNFPQARTWVEGGEDQRFVEYQGQILSREYLKNAF